MSADGNKTLVVAFYEQAFNAYQPEQAAEAHLGDRYTQHSPEAQDGPQAFVGYVHWLRGQFPDLRLDIKRPSPKGTWWSPTVICTSSPATAVWPSRTSGASPTGRSSSTGT